MIPQYWRGTMNDRTTQIIPKKSAENPADCETNDSTFAWDRSLGKCRPNQLGIDRRGAILPKIINMTPAPEEIIWFMLTGFAWTVPKKIINNTSTMISIRIKDKDAENTPLLHPFLLTCTVSLLLPRKLSRSAVTIDINRTAIMTATIISSHLDPHRSIFPSKPIWQEQLRVSTTKIWRESLGVRVLASMILWIQLMLIRFFSSILSFH